MQVIEGREHSLAVLLDPAFTVPSVPEAGAGIAWLRANVGRFSNGPDHARRRAVAVSVIKSIPTSRLGEAHDALHHVDRLARAMGIDEPVADLVGDVAQAYHPGTGDESLADAAVHRMVAICGGRHDESTAARIGVLVQASGATAALIDRLGSRPLEEILQSDPPVATTKRQATRATTVGPYTIGAGETILVSLAEGLGFGAGPRACPGREQALALAGRS